MALATLHIAAIPVLAGLVAGTGAVAFMGGDRPVQTATVRTEAPATTKSCDAQTWPYIEQRCLAGKASEDKRPVRLVTAPVSAPVEPTNATPAAPAAAPTPSAAAPSGNLMSRDTVLRAPNYYNSIPAVPDNLASEQRLTRKQMRREARKQRTERRWAAQSYQVPGEFDRRSARPIVVVRPLRLDAFR